MSNYTGMRKVHCNYVIILTLYGDVNHSKAAVIGTWLSFTTFDQQVTRILTLLLSGFLTNDYSLGPLSYFQLIWTSFWTHGTIVDQFLVKRVHQ